MKIPKTSSSLTAFTTASPTSSTLTGEAKRRSDPGRDLKGLVKFSTVLRNLSTGSPIISPDNVTGDQTVPPVTVNIPPVTVSDPPEQNSGSIPADTSIPPPQPAGSSDQAGFEGNANTQMLQLFTNMLAAVGQQENLKVLEKFMKLSPPRMMPPSSCGLLEKAKSCFCNTSLAILGDETTIAVLLPSFRDISGP